ncbi:CoA-binding protein [Ammonifex thiophilus]|uniref:CoA-binding protein n=1 Tax=Ammonifex thiophilus TaxID=444093 RepID=A0A3D8P228_9THEO|nr:CoA-binding protein [Ammonifex thiophilus]RDV80720.1 CoA-binding protein [Ammonifex thiophilus]
MKGDLADFLRKKRWAVVGASRDPQKYGHRIYFQLKELGYEVYAVNPNCHKIDGDPCYPSLSALPVLPEVVNIVVPPQVAEQVVEEAIRLGIKQIWLQPGAESPAVLEAAERAGLRVVYGQCVLLASRPEEG